MLIAYTGKKRSGKDLASDYLVEHYGYTKTRFAAVLKHIVQMIFNFPDTSDEAKENEAVVQIYDKNILEAFKELGIPQHHYADLVHRFYGVLGSHILFYSDAGATLKISNRKAQQLVGTDFGRNCIREDLWTSLTDISNPNTVIADCRFDSEAQFVKYNGGIVIEIINPFTETNDEHVSEQGIDPMLVDYTIINNSTKEYLYSKIDEALYCMKLFRGLS